MTTTLILWDIDHTLIETRGVGGRIYADAFRAVTGHELKTMPPLSGRTEPVIFREALAAHGLDDADGLYQRFAAEQAQGYAERLGELAHTGRALPGATDALRTLQARDDIVQSILTGNTREAASLKLQAFGLDPYLRLDLGAYGTDADDRPVLVGIARRRAENATGISYSPAHTILIGDTPNDVAAAHEGGARIIAVATGSYTSNDLASTGADTVLDDLADTSALLTAIYDGLARPTDL
jgi:phosphoglycolate phosphatase-like HAD superfamily hydrolase